MSKPNNTFLYRPDKTVQLILPSYSILDYDYAADKLLLGLWDSNLNEDRKIRKLFVSSPANLEGKKNVLSLDRSFELYSYLMNDGNTLLVYDGAGNYHKVDLEKGLRETKIMQDPLSSTISKDREYGLSKVTENIVLTMKHNPFELSPENVKKYGIKFPDQPVELVVKNTSANQVQSFVTLKAIYSNCIVFDRQRRKIFYLNSVGDGELLSFEFNPE